MQVHVFSHGLYWKLKYAAVKGLWNRRKVSSMFFNIENTMNMKTRFLQLSRTLRLAVLAIVFILEASKAYARFDFSIECETGQMLYYSITDTINHYVEISYPGSSISNSWNGYSMPQGDVLLPVSVINEGTVYTVTSIGSHAFNCCSEMNPLNIPLTVTHIGSLAFDYTRWYISQSDGVLYFDNCCLGYKGNMPTGTLSIQEGTRVIADDSFLNCDGLTGNLIIPNSVVTIGSQAFRGCRGFTGELNLSDSIIMIGGGAFEGCTQLTGNLILPNSITRIYGSTFTDCHRFTGDLIIPESVKEIGWSAFKNCNGFTGDLIIGDSVTIIDDYAFQSCRGFSGTLSIGKSVSKIGEYAFQYCSNFSEVQYHSNKDVDVSTIYPPFDNCGGNLYIDNGIERIPNGIFMKSCFTGDLILPNSIKEIGWYAFYDCTHFNGKLLIPDSIFSIKGDAFANCSRFSEVRFNAVNCLDNASSNYRPFQKCGGVLILGENVQRIPAYCFADAYFSGRLEFPNSITSIGDYAFYNCNGLTGDIALPNSLLSIGKYVFYNCYRMDGNLVIPSSITSIGDYTFYNCHSLIGALTIPTTVNSIGEFAFAKCSGFSGNLLLPSQIVEIENNAFSECSGFSGNLVIPNSVRIIGENAFSNCCTLDGNLIIGNMVREIGDKAFFGCNGFSTITDLGILPPSLGNEVFTGTDNDKLFVLCDKKDLFAFSEWGDYFVIQNIEEDCSFHTIAVNNGENIGGSIQPSATSALMGTVVSIFITQNSGFVISDIFVRNSHDENLIIPVVNNTFVMPNFDVTITPVFSHTAVNENNCSSVNIYPNPTNSHITIEAADLMHITISNLFGQIIYESNANSNEFAYDFSQQREGIYLIRIKTASGVVTKRVVVTR